MASYQDLVAEAKAEGVTEWYGFAEWLCHVKEYWGDPTRMDESDAETCYYEAQSWWEAAHR